MRRALKSALLAAALLVFVPQAARAEAQGPLPGGGRIDVGGGWRYLPGESGGGAVARFGWQADAHWLLGVELGFAYFHQQPVEGPVRVTVGKFLLTTTYQVLTRGPVLPYLSVGVGYGLIGAVASERYSESGATDFFGGVGFYVPLTERIGLVVEDRFELANASLEVHGIQRKVAGGGNLLWAGVVVTFAPEQDRILAP
ncbi:MAG: hypothetical protein P1V51_06265 [Deltaproteobacteria bacterium]|nr:hypothetical protein [Deltaproteobacteria bacterium]